MWVKSCALAARRWTLPVVTLGWAAFLFWVSTSTRGAEAVVAASPDVYDSLFDRLLPVASHLGGYAVLAGLVLLAGRRAWARLPMPVAASLVTTTLYGAAIELYQTTIPMREGTWGDVALNATGAAAALAALTALGRWRGSTARR